MPLNSWKKQEAEAELLLYTIGLKGRSEMQARQDTIWRWNDQTVRIGNEERLSKAQSSCLLTKPKET